MQEVAGITLADGLRSVARRKGQPYKPDSRQNASYIVKGLEIAMQDVAGITLINIQCGHYEAALGVRQYRPKCAY